MAIRYPSAEEFQAQMRDEGLCPTVQCAFCEQWMCDCQARATGCQRHFDDPCLIEGEPE